MKARFTCELPVRWGDIDVAGVLNNAVYMTFLEQARYEYAKHLGLLSGDHEDQFPYVLGEARIRFHRPGRAGMVLTVSARVTRLGGKSLEMSYEVRHQNTLLVTSEATLVCVDQTLRSAEIPDPMRRKISEFEGIPARG